MQELNYDDKFAAIDDQFKEVNSRFDSIDLTLKEIQIRGAASDDKLEAYQKANSQVVNLAFALMATAVIAIIIPAILR